MRLEEIHESHDMPAIPMSVRQISIVRIARLCENIAMNGLSNPLALWILTAIIAGSLLVATLVGWMLFGRAILLDLAATGLSWCM
jgi:hypothetical protein